MLLPIVCRDLSGILTKLATLNFIIKRTRLTGFHEATTNQRVKLHMLVFHGFYNLLRSESDIIQSVVDLLSDNVPPSFN